MAGQNPTSMAEAPSFIDDKSPHCIPFILSRLQVHQTQSPNSPFFIGLNGVQGVGKTTLVKALSDTLRNDEHLETLVCSIDDLYLTHDDQVELASSHAKNPLVQHRGEPGTHDMKLARELFTALKYGTPVKIPQYDKSAYGGQGDRVPSSQWDEVNQTGRPKVEVVIFEGWSVGFRALAPEVVEEKQAASRSQKSSTLWKYRLEDLLFVNEKLREYDVMTDTFDAFIHIDALETMYVYDWRLEQEAALRKEKGIGMTDEQVIKFVDGYYPAYELFTDALRSDVFKGSESRGKQLRLIVGNDRRVKEAVII